MSTNSSCCINNNSSTFCYLRHLLWLARTAGYQTNSITNTTAVLCTVYVAVFFVIFVVVVGVFILIN